MKHKVSDITKGLIQLEEKWKAMNDLRQKQIYLNKKITRIAKYPTPKRPTTIFFRTFRMYSYAMEIVILQQQIKMISWQPIFPKGGLPIVGGEYLKSKEEEK